MLARGSDRKYSPVVVLKLTDRRNNLQPVAHESVTHSKLTGKSGTSLRPRTISENIPPDDWQFGNFGGESGWRDPLTVRTMCHNSDKLGGTCWSCKMPGQRRPVDHGGYKGHVLFIIIMHKTPSMRGFCALAYCHLALQIEIDNARHPLDEIPEAVRTSAAKSPVSSDSDTRLPCCFPGSSRRIS